MKWHFNKSSHLAIAAALLSLYVMPFDLARAVNSGLDTPAGVQSLPFSVQGTQVMDLTNTGLAIGRGQDGGWQLEVQGTGDQHGIFGQAGAAGYWGVGGWSNNGAAYGGLGVGNAYGVYGVSSSGPGVYGQVTGSSGNWAGEFVGNNVAGSGGVLAYGGGSNWAGLFYGNTSGNGQYGVAAQGATWAGYFMGPVDITSGYLQFPDGSQQTTAAVGHPFGGLYATNAAAGCGGGLGDGNPYDGGACGCPSGFNSSLLAIISEATNTVYLWQCYAP
jgi:hypothetical protein